MNQNKKLDEPQKQGEANNGFVDYIEADIASGIVDQVWYRNYGDCLSFLANLNVENSNEITAVASREKNKVSFQGNQESVWEVYIKDNSLSDISVDDFRIILYNLFCSLGIENNWRDCYTDSNQSNTKTELLIPWKLNLKTLANKIREDFKGQIKSESKKLSLDHVQVWKIISKTPRYKKESKVVFKGLLENVFENCLKDLKSKQTVLDEIDDMKKISIIKAVKDGSGLLGWILGANLDESYKVLDQKTFDVFLDIIQELRSPMEKFLSEAKEKRSEVESEVSNYYKDLFVIFSNGLSKTLKEKVSWEQWKRFAELGCIDDKNYFFKENDSKIDDDSSELNGQFFMTRKDSLVDIFGGKELSKENVLAWIRDALNAIVKSHVNHFIHDMFKCFKSNWDVSKNETDFSNILNFSDVYAVMREVKFFEYIFQRILLESHISELDIFGVDKLDLTGFVDEFCEEFSKIQGFNLKFTEDDKNNMLQDFRWDLTKVLLEDNKVQKWLKDNENTQNEEDRKRRDKILALIETATKSIEKESNQKIELELEKLFNEKLEYSYNPGGAFGNASSTMEWIQEFKNNIVEICKKTAGMELKAVDQGMFNSFLGIVKNLQTKKMNDFSKEEIRDCYDAVWSLWNDNIKDILSGKINWEQWASFIEAFSIDDKNYFVINDYRVIPNNLKKFVDVTINSKESALDFLEKAFSLVTKANLTVIDIGHVESFIGILLNCMKFNPNLPLIDLSSLFNADEFYSVFSKTGLFKYVFKKVLVSGDALPQTFEQLNNLVSGLADGICNLFNGFAPENKNKLKEQMLSNFRSDMFEVLLFDEQLKAEIKKHAEEKLISGKSRSEVIAYLRDGVAKELMESNLESDQKQKSKYKQRLQKATTEKKTKDEKIENKKKEKKEDKEYKKDKKEEPKVIKQVEKKDKEDQLKKEQEEKAKKEKEEKAKKEQEEKAKKEKEEKAKKEKEEKAKKEQEEKAKKEQEEKAKKEKEEKAKKEKEEKAKKEKELKEKKDREGQLKEQRDKNSNNQEVINMAGIGSENTEENGNENQEKDGEKEEEANEEKRGENSVEEKKKEGEKELKPTVSTIKVNENIADNLEKNGKGNESKRGNTIAKVLFFVFLVPSIGFPIVAIVLSNPWLLLGLGFIVPTGICGYFGFKSLKQNEINLGGGNNLYDKDNANSTMDDTITNAKTKQKSLDQSKRENVPDGEIKNPNEKA